MYLFDDHLFMTTMVDHRQRVDTIKPDTSVTRILVAEECAGLGTGSTILEEVCKEVCPEAEVVTSYASEKRPTLEQVPEGKKQVQKGSH